MDIIIDEVIDEVRADLEKGIDYPPNVKVLGKQLFFPVETLADCHEGDLSRLKAIRMGMAQDVFDLLAENIADAGLSPAEADKFMAILHNLKPRKIIEAPVFED